MWLSLLIKHNSFLADREHCRNQEQIRRREQVSVVRPTQNDPSIRQVAFKGPRYV